MKTSKKKNYKLTRPEKEHVAQWIAEGHGCVEIAEMVQREFGKKITHQNASKYGTYKWVQARIEEIRKEWKADVEDVAISHRRYRLIELQKHYNKIKDGYMKTTVNKDGDVVEFTEYDPYAVARLMATVQKEIEAIEGKGKPNENQAGIHSGGGDINIIQHYHGVSDDELDRADRGIDEELRKHGYIKAPTNRGIDLTPSSN